MHRPEKLTFLSGERRPPNGCGKWLNRASDRADAAFGGRALVRLDEVDAHLIANDTGHPTPTNRHAGRGHHQEELYKDEAAQRFLKLQHRPLLGHVEDVTAAIP